MAERVLGGLQPERVFYYFEEIAGIPHPSYHEQAISDYLVSFAKEHHFEYRQDDALNVILIRPASPGYEDEPPIILQGHMDMVCEKTKTCDKDMFTEGLDLFIDGDLIGAAGTTLGGDDGIAIAYALALFEDETLTAPRLEFVCTTSEETGMEGAAAVDLSFLKGKRLLNIDSEKEGELVCGCAGGARLHVELPLHRIHPEENDRLVYRKIHIDGLLGGHSGTEIDKGRANANMLMARILRHILRTQTVCLYHFSGGQKDNAIPRDSEAILAMTEDVAKIIDDLISDEYTHIKEEYSKADPDIRVSVSEISEAELPDFEKAEEKAAAKKPIEFDFDDMADLVLNAKAGSTQAGSKDNEGRTLPISSEETRRIVMLLLSLPNGVIRMSDHIEGLVETSLNLGTLSLGRDALSITYSLRSSVEAAYDALRENMIFMAEGYGAKATVASEYPAWEFSPDSDFRKTIASIYQKQTGKEVTVCAIHAGLECGILSNKIQGLDAVSMGPDLFDIHTPAERMSISSVARVYEWIREIVSVND